MKISRLLVTTFAASSLLLASCDKKADDSKGGGTTSSGGGAVSEKDAIERFKTQMKDLKAETEKAQAAAKDDPTAQMGLMKVLMPKFQAVKTDGLPADMKSAFEGLRTAMGKMGDMFKDMPEKKEDRMAWAMKIGTDPKFGPQMQAVQGELEKASNDMKAAAKAHGIEDLDLGK